MFLSNLDRRVLSTLRDNAVGRVKPGLRIAVLGNCHSLGIAYAMKLLKTGATVHRFPIQIKPKITGNLLIRALQTYDHVFYQDLTKGWLRGVSTDVLEAKLAKPTGYPTLFFGAYHPDSIFVHDRAKSEAFVWGPLGQHHSALALFAYRAGLSAEAALRLYRREVFETLGYFDVWDGARATLLAFAKPYSLDFSADFLRWTRRGCFMYTINHPKPHVFFDVGRRLFDKAGIPYAPVDFDNYALDDLARDAVFPVYPAIAEHYGVPGSYVFKAAQYVPGGLDMGSFWDLAGFVRESYRVYGRHKAENLTNERVQTWLDDPEICGFLQDTASQKRGVAPSLKEKSALVAEPAPTTS
jgi:hypothetical protein